MPTFQKVDFLKYIFVLGNTKRLFLKQNSNFEIRKKGSERYICIVQIARLFYMLKKPIRVGRLVVAFKADCLTRDLGLWGVLSVGGLSKGSQPVLTRVSEKTTENSERLGRQARKRIEPGIFLLPIFSAETLSHWWHLGQIN